MLDPYGFILLENLLRPKKPMREDDFYERHSPPLVLRLWRKVRRWQSRRA